MVPACVDVGCVAAGVQWWNSEHCYSRPATVACSPNWTWPTSEGAAVWCTRWAVRSFGGDRFDGAGSGDADADANGVDDSERVDTIVLCRMLCVPADRDASDPGSVAKSWRHRLH